MHTSRNLCLTLPATSDDSLFLGLHESSYQRISCALSFFFLMCSLSAVLPKDILGRLLISPGILYVQCCCCTENCTTNEEGWKCRNVVGVGIWLAARALSLSALSTKKRGRMQDQPVKESRIAAQSLAHLQPFITGRLLIVSFPFGSTFLLRC